MEKTPLQQVIALIKEKGMQTHSIDDQMMWEGLAEEVAELLPTEREAMAVMYRKGIEDAIAGVEATFGDIKMAANGVISNIHRTNDTDGA